MTYNVVTRAMKERDDSNLTIFSQTLGERHRLAHSATVGDFL
jgi:hypothetical protein